MLARMNAGETSSSSPPIRWPKKYTPSVRASRNVSAVMTTPVTRLMRTALSKSASSTSFRCTSAEAQPSNVRMTASGTMARGTAARPNSEGGMRCARTTAETNANDSAPTRASATHRTPRKVASRSEPLDPAAADPVGWFPSLMDA